MTYLLFAVALALSAVAAWYAIVGLMAIFAAAAIPIAIMGSLLEAAKLVTASWLYRSWNEIPKLFKVYFLTAVIVLMMLTSMGIFGFLSKAHLDQAVPTGDIASQVALIDEKINIQKENINAARKTLNQLDTIADQAISRTDDARGLERANQIRRSQTRERNRLIQEISTAQTEIASLNKQKEPIAKELRKVEAEVGPIKYIAALIYGDNTDADILEKSVRVVTLLIVAVFDPLAVLLLVAANWQLKREKINVEVPNLSQTTIQEPNPQPEPEKDIEVTHKISEEDITIPKSEELEIPEISIEEHSKDWEPELYDRVQPKKEVGRYMQETGKSPPKTQSFLKKVQSLFEPKTIEKEVEELQKPK